MLNVFKCMHKPTSRSVSSQHLVFNIFSHCPALFSHRDSDPRQTATQQVHTGPSIQNLPAEPKTYRTCSKHSCVPHPSHWVLQAARGSVLLLTQWALVKTTFTHNIPARLTVVLPRSASAIYRHSFKKQPTK